MNQGRATIKQVAQEAGVSTQTVSRVLNERPDVAPQTRQRVQEIINRLGYHPSAVARSLIHQRSYTLAVVTAGLDYLGPSRTLNGITQKAEELDYTLILKELPRFDIASVQPVLRMLLASQADGIIWAVPEVGENRVWMQDQLPNLPVPMIFLTMAARPEITAVSIDNYLGGCMATQHLIDQGRRHIAHITGPMDWWEARQRKQGWWDTLTKAGLSVSETGWVEGNWSTASGEEAFCQLINHYPEMDAVFVANDQMAIAVIHTAWRNGLQVPGDLAVVGFDGIPESAYFWPALTTVNQDQSLVGCIVVQELVQMIEAQHSDTIYDSKTIWLQPELIIRESSLGPGLPSMARKTIVKAASSI